MKKIMFVLVLSLIALPAMSQTADPIISWATTYPILPITYDPILSATDDLAPEMGGGVAIGEHLYYAGGYLPNATVQLSGAADSDRVFRWALDGTTGAMSPAVEQPRLPNTDSYAYIFEMVTATENAIYIAGGGWNFTGPNPPYVTYNLIGTDGNLTSTDWLVSATFPTANDKGGAGTGPYAPEMGGSVICENGYLYVFGGDQENTASVLSLDCFYAQIQGDGSLGAWQTGTQLPDYFWFGGSCSIGNYIIACPGIKGSRARADSSDLVYVCQVNSDGSMGAWVEQTDKLPGIIYNQSFVAAGDTVFCIGGRDGVTGLSKDIVWRAPFNSTTGVLGPWTDSTDVQLPSNGARYHQVSYSEFTKRIYVYSIRRDGTANSYPNEAYISSPLFPLGPTPTPTITPTPTATPITAGMKSWNDFR